MFSWILQGLSSMEYLFCLKTKYINQSLSLPESESLKSSLRRWEGIDKWATGELDEQTRFLVEEFGTFPITWNLVLSLSESSDSEALESELESESLELELSDSTPTSCSS